MSTKADDPRYATTDGRPPAPGHENAATPQPYRPDGMAEAYWVLSEEERAKGFTRPLRRSYRHQVCRTTTRMGLALCETYARDPSFYGATFCCACGGHFPVAEFTWTEDGERVGT